MSDESREKGNPPTKDVNPEEAIERAWATNDKLTYDLTLQHCHALRGQSEQLGALGNANVAEAISFQKAMNNITLQREAQRLEVDKLSSMQYLENNRYTMNYLYTIMPEEGLMLVQLMRELNTNLKKVAKTE